MNTPPKTHIVIPARLKSTRLPNKPLALIHGKAMILWVIDRAQAVQRAGVADDVWVATDDNTIADLCRQYGAQVVLTNPNHPSGTDRLGEVAQQLGWQADDIVINMQGDEPLVPVALIEQVSRLLRAQPECVMATLAEPIGALDEFLRPSVVKVVMSPNQHALYFSRAPIPHQRTADPTAPVSLPSNALRHLGLYAYRVSLLQVFGGWAQGALEQIESLEQLRILEHGGKIAIDIARVALPAGVDTPADLERLNRMDLAQFLG